MVTRAAGSICIFCRYASRRTVHSTSSPTPWRSCVLKGNKQEMTVIDEETGIRQLRDAFGGLPREYTVPEVSRAAEDSSTASVQPQTGITSHSTEKQPEPSEQRYTSPDAAIQDILQEKLRMARAALLVQTQKKNPPKLNQAFNNLYLRNPSTQELVHVSQNKPPMNYLNRAGVLASQFAVLQHDSTLRYLLRTQLTICKTRQQYLRLLAVATSTRRYAVNFAKQATHMKFTFYNIRHSNTDPDILSLVRLTIKRLDQVGVDVQQPYFDLALMFAARSRSLESMRWVLSEFRQRNLHLSNHLFRSAIAKFSIGCLGLGELRNGRWRKKDLLQVLLGFEGVPEEKACHLGKFLVRSDWQSFHGWIAVLARCRAIEELRKEWQLWLSDPRHSSDRKVFGPRVDRNAMLRGARWFAEQFSRAGDFEASWHALEYSGIDFAILHPDIKNLLLDNIQHATRWTTAIKEGVLEKYGNDMLAIEKALGVDWVRDENNPDGGYHVPSPDMDGALERLAKPLPKLEFGFPSDSEGDSEMLDPLGDWLEEEEFDSYARRRQLKNIKGTGLSRWYTPPQLRETGSW